VWSLFKDRQFRLFWIASVFSDMALITYFTVHGWLALQVSDSPLWVGITAGTGGLALTLFAVVGGVLSDRITRRQLVLTTLTVRGLLGLTLAILILTDNIRLWHIIVASFAEGMVASAHVPTMMAMTMDIVGRERLLSATAARFAGMTIVGIVAPLLAGAIVSRFDIGYAYVVIAACYGIAPFLILAMRKVAREPRERTTPLEDFKQGLAYVISDSRVRTLILMIFVVEGFGWAHEAMMPVMARDVLDAGASGLGYLLAAGSAGATVSSIVMSNVGEINRKSLLIVGGSLGFGLFLVVFSFVRWLPVSLALIAAAYASVVMYETTVNTVLQTSVPDSLRGRVLSFQAMMWGVSGLAGFHTGAIANAVGAPVAIAIGGAVVVVNAGWVLRKVARFDAVQPEPATEV
jgi:predicted MFS family arabinose efflux permease|tara:strand:+ start:1214 stop:2428 length:1215 start_codon:yes stop_codon:yes gene_type:complete